MRPVLFILLTMIILGGALWVAQGYHVLHIARNQMLGAWLELREALLARREMIPYIVAAVPFNVASVLDILGNACDLAANVEGVVECSQAEARLSSAIGKLFSRLDAEASVETLEMISSLRDRIKVQAMKIELLKDLYNRQVELFNALQQRGSGRVLASLGMVNFAELF